MRNNYKHKIKNYAIKNEQFCTQMFNIDNLHTFRAIKNRRIKTNACLTIKNFNLK